MKLRLFLSLLLFGFACHASADSFDANLSDDSARFIYGRDYGNMQMECGWLFNENDDWLAQFGLQGVGEERRRNGMISGGFGGRAYWVEVGSNDIVAIGLGGQIHYFPRNGAFGFGGFVYYAPNVTTGGDADRLLDIGARLELKLLENSRLYVGYRKITTHLEVGSDADIDKGPHVVVHIRF